MILRDSVLPVSVNGGRFWKYNKTFLSYSLGLFKVQPIICGWAMSGWSSPRDNQRIWAVTFRNLYRNETVTVGCHNLQMRLGFPCLYYFSFLLLHVHCIFTNALVCIAQQNSAESWRITDIITLGKIPSLSFERVLSWCFKKVHGFTLV